MLFDFSKERWYQTEAINSIKGYFDSGATGNPLVLMPTGSGKTHIPVGFMQRVLMCWPNQRFGVVTHVQELIEQNAAKFAEAWPYAPMGVYSAGLKSRDYAQPVIFGGVQSMVKVPELFGHRDIIFVDEAHLVAPGDATNYQILFNALRKINPYLKIVGMTATAYRMGLGMITEPHEGQIFTDICYDLTTMDSFARLIGEGFLSPLIAKKTATEIDVSGVARGRDGDFNRAQLQQAANREKITYAALQEAIYYGQNRRSWLVFAAGVEHSENVAAMMNQMGIPTVCVHSKLKDPKERKKRIDAHKAGEARAMVGNNIFTTGYDHPPLDFIVDLQPTMSVPKHVQKYGRGMRVSPLTMKQNCLVLDFGGNIVRNGPINDPYIPSRSKKTGGDAPVRICDVCGAYNHPSYRFCEGCGAEFEFEVKITKEAAEVDIMVNDIPVVEIFPVNQVFYYRHVSKSGNVCLAVNYFSGLTKFDEWISWENPKARHLRNEWWRARHADAVPETIEQALAYANNGSLRYPSALRVRTDTKYPEIMGVIW